MAGIELATRMRRAIHLNDPLLLQSVIANDRRGLQSPDVSDKSNTSLHLAAKLGHLEVVVSMDLVKACMSNNNHVVMSFVIMRGMSWFAVAVYPRTSLIVDANPQKYLVEASHESNGISRNAKLETPLQLAINARPVSTATDAVAFYLAQTFPRSLQLKDSDGINAIMLCAQRPRNQIATDQLLSRLLTLQPSGPLLYAADDKGNTALHCAASYGQTYNIKILLDAGADPNALNKLNWTPIAYSATVQVEVFFRSLLNARSGGEPGVRGRSRGASGSNNAPVRLVKPEAEISTGPTLRGPS